MSRTALTVKRPESERYYDQTVIKPAPYESLKITLLNWYFFLCKSIVSFARSGTKLKQPILADARSGRPDCMTSLRRAQTERPKLHHHSSKHKCSKSMRCHTTHHTKGWTSTCRPQAPGHHYTLSLCSVV